MPIPPVEGVPALAAGPRSAVRGVPGAMALADDRPLSPMKRLAQRDRDGDQGGVDIQVPVPGAEAPEEAEPVATAPEEALPRTGLEMATTITVGLAMAAAGLALLASTRARLGPSQR